ncbi:hypothetical protein PVK06_014422 [Gossypium arboreum]|uniref:Uncharacterized protein n=1 Tax=Gossypium arboreum TaxID=29729 RepID=A0ABR0PV12_GOSAR|nr:hypothetical protein PVK06_014422 [Gossypium arboreum]
MSWLVWASGMASTTIEPSNTHEPGKKHNHNCNCGNTPHWRKGFPKKGFRVLSFSSALLHEGDGISSHQDHFDQSAFAGAASSRFASFGKGFSLLPSVLSNGILNLDDAASANVWATFNCK